MKVDGSMFFLRDKFLDDIVEVPNDCLVLFDNFLSLFVFLLKLHF